MNAIVEHNLAALLFLPWFLILGTLYWMLPRQPRDAARRRFDGIALGLATLVFFVAIHAARLATAAHDHIWQQIVATATGYVAFLGALTVAVLLRQRWIKRRRDAEARHAGRLGDFSA